MFMLDFAGKRLDKARDTQLIKIQTNLLYVANPLAKLWSEVVEQGSVDYDGRQSAIYQLKTLNQSSKFIMLPHIGMYTQRYTTKVVYTDIYIHRGDCKK